MNTPEQVLGYVKQFIESVGVDPSTCWNEQNKAYYIYKGSARIEIFVSSHPENNGTTRHYCESSAD